MNQNIESLLSALTYENWFTQLAILSDAYRESGDDAKADRCDDLRLARKRPMIDRGQYYAFYGTTKPTTESHLSNEAVFFIDGLNKKYFTKSIRPQLTAYLQVPEHLRIARPKS